MVCTVGSMLHTLPFLLPALLSIEVEPGQPIVPSAPWAVAPEGPRSYLERISGRRIDPRTVPPIRDGTLVFDAESMAVEMLSALDIPPEAGFDFDPTPGILYVAMDGVQVTPLCGGPQSANAALNCSPLVDGVVNFPPLAGGNPQTKASVFQKLGNYYAPFNLVMSTNRPPDWLPYTMAVVGGSSQLAGKGGGVCGIANVACDGAKRNHVSLSFSDSCPGDVAEVAAQETAHNWGLEHTDVQQDLMYPFVAGGSSFRDQCMGISHATGSGITQCTYVHEHYCPAGGGEEQNSHAELMGVFGPRAADTEKPQILSVKPADGSEFTTDDSLVLTATIQDNSNFIGVNWTWLEGLPPDLDGYRRCTNDVCDDGYGAWKPQSEPYDFITLKKPPVGTYKFKVEAMDAYGNHAAQTITIRVVQGGGDTSESAGDDTSGGSTGDPGGDESGTPPTGDDGGTPTTGGGDDTSITSITSISGGGDDSSGGAEADGDEGCGSCRVEARPGPWALLLLLGLGAGRRRRRA